MYGGYKIPVGRSGLLLLPQKEKAKENWRKSHYESLNNKWRSRNAVTVNEMGGVCGACVCRLWRAKLDKKRPVGAHRPTWEDNIQTEWVPVGRTG
jgi:hypothetical protein